MPVPAKVWEVLASADQLELLSLVPLSANERAEKAWGSKEKFHGDGVLGRVVLKDQEEREWLIENLEGGLRHSDQGAMCFFPHHGIRAKKGDQVVDVLICFSCHWAYIYTTEGKKEYYISGSYSRARVFDHLFLARHGLPLELKDKGRDPYCPVCLRVCILNVNTGGKDMPTASADRSVVINLRMKSRTRDLIDLAARTNGKNRSEFLVEAATRAAQEALVDQRLFSLTPAQWKQFTAALDAPPRPNPKLRDLMKRPAPWER